MVQITQLDQLTTPQAQERVTKELEDIIPKEVPDRDMGATGSLFFDEGVYNHLDGGQYYELEANFYPRTNEIFITGTHIHWGETVELIRRRFPRDPAEFKLQRKGFIRAFAKNIEGNADIDQDGPTEYTSTSDMPRLTPDDVKFPDPQDEARAVE